MVWAMEAKMEISRYFATKTTSKIRQRISENVQAKQTQTDNDNCEIPIQWK